MKAPVRAYYQDTKIPQTQRLEAQVKSKGGIGSLQTVREEAGYLAIRDAEFLPFWGDCDPNPGRATEIGAELIRFSESNLQCQEREIVHYIRRSRRLCGQPSEDTTRITVRQVMR